MRTESTGGSVQLNFGVSQEVIPAFEQQDLLGPDPRSQNRLFFPLCARSFHADSRWLPCGTLWRLHEQSLRQARQDPVGLPDRRHETRQGLLHLQP